MKIQVLSLFPDYFNSPLKEGLLARAIQQSLVEINFVNPREFSSSKTSRVDDYPFGGGDSMILSYEPLAKSLKSLKDRGKLLYLTPSGSLWNAQKARQCAQSEKLLTFVCGRYGGVDQRFVDEFVDEEISIGDYILNGGEAACLVLIESIFRFLPKALGNKASCQQESFEGEGLLECPQWTRPQAILEHEIPEVLLSGNHAEINQFRKDCSLLITAIKRPDIMNQILQNSKDILTSLVQAQKNLSKLPLKQLQSLSLQSKDLDIDFTKILKKKS